MESEEKSLAFHMAFVLGLPVTERLLLRYCDTLQGQLRSGFVLKFGLRRK